MAENDLGLALYHQKKYPESVAAYKKAIVLNPKSQIAYNGLGAALYGAGSIDQAVAAYRQALDISPRYVDAMNNLGAALDAPGQVRRSCRSVLPRGGDRSAVA